MRELLFVPSKAATPRYTGSQASGYLNATRKCTSPVTMTVAASLLRGASGQCKSLSVFPIKSAIKHSTRARDYPVRQTQQRQRGAAEEHMVLRATCALVRNWRKTERRHCCIDTHFVLLLGPQRDLQLIERVLRRQNARIGPRRLISQDLLCLPQKLVCDARSCEHFTSTSLIVEASGQQHSHLNTAGDGLRGGRDHSGRRHVSCTSAGVCRACTGLTTTTPRDHPLNAHTGVSVRHSTSERRRERVTANQSTQMFIALCAASVLV